MVQRSTDPVTLSLEHWERTVAADPAAALHAAAAVLLREVERSLLAEAEAVATWPAPPAACRSQLDLSRTRARVRAAERVLQLCEAKIRSDRRTVEADDLVELEVELRKAVEEGR